MGSGINKTKKNNQQRRKWTLKEDNLLLKIIRKYGKNWC